MGVEKAQYKHLLQKKLRKQPPAAHLHPARKISTLSPGAVLAATLSTMLRHLTIRNFAIVREARIDVQPGFTAVTGETGAGKSILVDALGLLLGARADIAQIAANAEQAELEALFFVAPDSPAAGWLQEQALHEGEELILRRLLNRGGGSRAWINGRAATVSQLAELGALLVEIHGQHAHQQLVRPEMQRELLDRHVQPEALAAVEQAFADWQEARSQLDALETRAGDLDRVELLRFQVQELDALALGPEEYPALESEHERLARSDELLQAVALASRALEDEQIGGGARSLLQQALEALTPLQALDADLAESLTMLEEARINVDEALASLERTADRDRGDPQRLHEVNRRLEKIVDLARKYRVAPGELAQLHGQLGEQLQEADSLDERRQQLQALLEKRLDQWQLAAAALTTARGQAAHVLTTSLDQRLAELGMDAARLEFSIEAQGHDRPGPHGQDRIGIQFSANPGQPPKPLSRVASGGELSRLGLALMSSVQTGFGPPVRIFDEVDAGVGGETAHAVGRFLRAAADGGQAMCVTHLAQVAACADQQIRVLKEKQADSTRVRVETLDEAAREREIARMLGSADSARSRAHAGELLAAARS